MGFYTTDTASPPSASFNDTRCEYKCVYSTDPLLFTCKLSNLLALQVVLPNGDHEHLSLGDDRDLKTFVTLPGGFTAVSLNISVINDSTRNFSIAISIANASLLEGGEIICDDTTPKKKVMAGCPVCGEF